MNEEMWLEEAGKYMDTEYWCPELQHIEYMDPYDWSDFIFKQLVFEKWEIEQMELYQDGLGNERLPMERVNVSGLMAAIDKVSEKIFAVSGIPRGCGGIEYTERTYKYTKRKRV